MDVEVQSVVHHAVKPRLLATRFADQPLAVRMFLILLVSLIEIHACSAILLMGWIGVLLDRRAL